MAKSKKSIICVIPARYHSTRLPGKPLVDIAGRPMIEWVYARASVAELVERVLVATDDVRIHTCVEKFGGESIMTSPELSSGTDRVAAAVQGQDCDIVINVQGDEPLIEPKEIDLLAQMMLNNPDTQMGTLVRRAKMSDGFEDTGSAKVVLDKENNAIYFSRSPIPFHRSDGSDGDGDMDEYWKHVGVYAYTKSFLMKFVSWEPSPLEKIEKLEQLRVLENGGKIKAVETPYKHHCVDTPEDLERVRRLVI